MADNELLLRSVQRPYQTTLKPSVKRNLKLLGTIVGQSREGIGFNEGPWDPLLCQPKPWKVREDLFEQAGPVEMARELKEVELAPSRERQF